MSASTLQPSIQLSRAGEVTYLLRLADTCLFMGQRLSEWCGHAPILEEDIAMANIALDLIGQARALYAHAGEVEGRGHDEDQLAFLREERDYFNLTITELPRGDFAFTMVRNAMVCTWLKLMWERLQDSSDAELAGIAGKALKEARYHQQHAADWVVRLADGTDESRRRLDAALPTLWIYTREFFDADEVDELAESTGLGPRASDLRDAWLAEFGALLDEAQLPMPKDSAFRSEGRRGRHSEHMGFMLTELQYLQRAYPGGAW
jgi:ring-1,2-phenylacetyl-CoA epoxidase subunit PaaC